MNLSTSLVTLATSLTIAATLWGASEDLVAQDPLQRGASVRVTAPDCGLSVAARTFQALRADTLVFTTTECPLASVTTLDVRARRRRARRGALIGGVAGLVAGVFMGAGYHDFCESWSCDPTFAAAGGFLLGVAAGVALGAGVGALIKTDRWEEVPLDGLRLSFEPQLDGRIALGFSVRF